MAVSRDDVRHVAALARLEVSEEDLEPMRGELNAILEYVGRLDELHTDDVPPTSHVLALTNVFRSDSVDESLSRENALLNAPSEAMGHFRVPKVIE